MTALKWGKVGDRNFETGLDRGVLYLPDGSAVPWNGLTSIIESFDKETQPVYFDGMKINNLVALGDFSASMKAVTYPDEFIEFEGLGKVNNGVYYADQPPQYFGLCYRTQVGNDLDGSAVGYKIHILYNVTAIPTDKTYATISADPSLVEFEWEISAVPEEVPGFRPTAHIVLDTRNVDPWLITEIEELLYGGSVANASLLPMSELVDRLNDFFRVKIIDNGDGTWTAITDREGFIFVDDFGLFTLIGVNAVYISTVEYILSDTRDVADVPQIQINDNGDGTWSARTDQDNIIVTVDVGEVEIRNANIVIINSTTYQISDTTSDG